MYLACAMAKHHHDDGEGRSRGRCHHDVAQNPKQQFREKFLPVFVCGRFFFFFFCRVVFAMRPNRFAHIRGTADTVAIMGIEYGWPPSCHLATFCLFFVLASFGLLCKCVCVFLSTIHAHLRCLIALGYIHIRCLLARKRDCDCN